jgi:hypothetical protein
MLPVAPSTATERGRPPLASPESADRCDDPSAVGQLADDDMSGI